MSSHISFCCNKRKGKRQGHKDKPTCKLVAEEHFDAMEYSRKAVRFLGAMRAGGKKGMMG